MENTFEENTFLKGDFMALFKDDIPNYFSLELKDWVANLQVKLYFEVLEEMRVVAETKGRVARTDVRECFSGLLLRGPFMDQDSRNYRTRKSRIKFDDLIGFVSKYDKPMYISIREKWTLEAKKYFTNAIHLVLDSIVFNLENIYEIDNGPLYRGNEITKSDMTWKEFENLIMYDYEEL